MYTLTKLPWLCINGTIVRNIAQDTSVHKRGRVYAHEITSQTAGDVRRDSHLLNTGGHHICSLSDFDQSLVLFLMFFQVVSVGAQRVTMLLQFVVALLARGVNLEQPHTQPTTSVRRRQIRQHTSASNTKINSNCITAKLLLHKTIILLYLHVNYMYL